MDAMQGLLTHEDIGRHRDAVEPHHVHQPIPFRGDTWDLAHLDAFAMGVTLGQSGQRCTVIVMFSCHCYTMGIDPRVVAPPEEIYRDGRETRVLCPTRYALSRRYFPQLIRDLPIRRILVGRDGRAFLTVEDLAAEGGKYLVVFETTRDRERRGRVLLRVKTAHVREQLSQRDQNARKVNFHVLLQRALEGKAIRE